MSVNAVIPEHLKTEAYAVSRIYQSEDWQVVSGLLGRHIEALREKNETILPESERLFLLGQLYALRYVNELPQKIAEKVQEYKQVQDAVERPREE